MTIAEAIPIIDTDSHVAEPIDLWSSRLPSKWSDLSPTVAWDENAGEDRWKVGDIWLSGVGEYCTAGWTEHFPSHPPTLEEADPACYDARARLQRMDEHGVDAQVLYPNLIAFDADAFLRGLGPELALECVRAYNDFLIDFASADPERFIPIMMVPFWDIEASITEMERSAGRGHKGMLFAAPFERLGLKNIIHSSWDPLLSAAQDLDLSLNFHIGFGAQNKDDIEQGWRARTKKALDEYTNRISFVRKGAAAFASCAQATADVCVGGVAERFPRLKFVSVESGFGYFPYLLDNMDWLWQTSGACHEFPNREKPSFYFFRQVYVTMWQERRSIPLLEEFQDNVMFETDFPHETGLGPGPCSPAKTGRETARENLGALPDDVVRKVLHDNAAKLYRVG
jgi:predicted TIM-barrel fold metal-dependent hydrolase